jgi:hypothetical protein
VAQIALDGARIDAVIRQLVTAAMPQHVRVDLHVEARRARRSLYGTNTLNHTAECLALLLNDVCTAPVRDTADAEEAIAKLGREPGGSLIVPRRARSPLFMTNC